VTPKGRSYGHVSIGTTSSGSVIAWWSYSIPWCSARRRGDPCFGGRSPIPLPPTLGLLFPAPFRRRWSQPRRGRHFAPGPVCSGVRSPAGRRLYAARAALGSLLRVCGLVERTTGLEHATLTLATRRVHPRDRVTYGLTCETPRSNSRLHPAFRGQPWPSEVDWPHHDENRGEWDRLGTGAALCN